MIHNVIANAEYHNFLHSFPFRITQLLSFVIRTLWHLKCSGLIFVDADIEPKLAFTVKQVGLVIINCSRNFNSKGYSFGKWIQSKFIKVKQSVYI